MTDKEQQVLTDELAESLRGLKDNAVQQAQMWAQEARTQRATVLEILRYFGLPEHDYEALSLIKAKLEASTAPAGVTPELPDAIRVPLDELHADAQYLAARLANGSMSVSVGAAAIRRKLDAIRAALSAAAPAGEGVTPEETQQMRLTLIGQVHELIDLAERHAWIDDPEERRRTLGAIAHARKVTERYNYNGRAAGEGTNANSLNLGSSTGKE
jgi:hypothetical protein